ncbi:MAG: hypothetical protein JSW68_02310, partial [Burkholderiales bacterium]
TDRDMALIADPWAGGNGAPSAASARAKGAAPAAARVMVEHGGHDYRWNGVVDRVEAAVDAATRTFNVVVRVPDPSARGAPLRDAPVPGPPLLVGMYATVEIEGRDVGAYAMLPGAAVRDDGRVWLVDDDGKLTARKVRMLTERDDRMVVDAADLPAGGRVVVSELRVATEGMQVRVVGGEGGPGRAVAEHRQ